MFRHEFYGPAVVQAIGKLDEHHTHVVVKGKKYALEVLCLHALLLCLVLVVKHGLDLCQTVHEAGNLFSEKDLEVVNCV